MSDTIKRKGSGFRIQEMNSSRSFLLLIVLSFLGLSANAADQVRIQRDLEYARIGDTSLKLDLYVPAAAKSPPIVVWVHGGAWRSGSKNNPSVLPRTERGY